MQLNPYLMFKGDCEEAIRFYEKCLGGKIVTMMSYGDTPMMKHMPPDWGKKIIHATLNIGDKIVMASDAPPDRYETPKGFSVALGIGQVAEAERIFAELGEGGTVRMPLQKTFWAERFGEVVDRFGIPWMVNCENVTEPRL